MIKFDFDTYRKNIISDETIKKYEPKFENLKTFFELNKKNMGFYDVKRLTKDINKINEASEFIKSNCDVFLVIGIGGSYIGSLSVIEALNKYFYNDTKKPEIYFLGNSLSSSYLNDLINKIKDKEIIVNIISKSGNTFEVDVTYNVLLKMLKEKYNEEDLKERIIITTTKNNELYNNTKSKYVFEIPEDIGGRFSVFTSAGLLPIAVSNINIELLLKGALESQITLDNHVLYAIIRDIMYKNRYYNEAFVVYEPKLYALTEWIKQLYAESLGKEEKGILPINIINTRDLHSLGQFIQEGKKILFETVINIENTENDIYIEKYSKTLNEINNIASMSTSSAHYNANILNNIITLKKLDEYTLGYLMQFFMISCSISGYISNVNAFNQDGVEEYKKIMKNNLK